MNVSATPFRFWSQLLGILAGLLGGLLNAHAVTLAWDPNNEPDLQGYRLRYKATPDGQPVVINVGNATNYEVPGLSPGTTYSFTVTALNTAGLESTASNEVTYTPPDPLADGDQDGLPNGWETEHGLDPSSATVANGALGDPDADGIDNFQEYVFALDPQQSSQQGLPYPGVTQDSGSGLHYLTLTYRKRVDTNRLVYKIEASPDLLTWSEPSFEEIPPPVPPSGASITVTVRLLPAIETLTEPLRFARVRVQTTAPLP